MGSNLSISGGGQDWEVVTPPAVSVQGSMRGMEESEDSADDHPDPPPPPPPPPPPDRESSDRSVTPRHVREKADSRPSSAGIRLRGKSVPGLDEALPDERPCAPRWHMGYHGRDKCEYCWKPISHFASGREQHRWYNVRCLRWQRYLEGDCTWTYAGKWAGRKAEERFNEYQSDQPLRAAGDGHGEKGKKEKKKKRPDKRLSPSPEPPKKEKRHRRPPSEDEDDEPMPTLRKLGPGKYLLLSE